MGLHAHIDTAAIRAVADRIDSVGHGVARAAPQALRFDGAVAGRNYAADGDALRRGLERFAIDMTAWARSLEEIAAGLRCGAERYADADRGATTRLG